MATLTIEIPDSLLVKLEQTGQTAQEAVLKALERYAEIDQYDDPNKLLVAINSAYADGPDEEDKAVQRRMRSSHRKLVEGEW